MNINAALLCPWESPKYLIFSSNVPPLLHYSHIPAIIIALLLTGYIFLNNKKSLSAITLFVLASFFSLYAIFDVIIWASNRSDLIMFLWSLIILIEILVFFASFYLTYVFVNNTDLSFNKKIIVVGLLLPLIYLMPTKYNLIGINISTCDAFEGFIALYYSYILEIFFTLWIMFLCIAKYRSAKEGSEKKRVGLFGLGIILFLLAFSWGNIIGSFTEDWRYSQYGLFGMPVFMGFLAYLIVKHQAFNIKLLSIEVLVPALVILIGSQFAFIQNTINQILTGIALAASVIFGYVLVRSIRTEAKEREKLATMTHELEHANQELKELDKVKSDFISIVSHQLRTPLTVTKGYTSMILEGGAYGSPPDKIKDPLQKVYVSNEGLIALVNNLLDLSRMEAGTIKYDFVDADLAKMVDEIVMELELEAKHRNLYLKWERPTESLPMIKADTIKLKQVIEILIENSLKYTPQGGVNVSLAKDTNSLIFKVEDTGIGIEPHETEHLFNKFGRGKEGSRVNATGLGLGLYAAKQIVLKHNGDIRAESEGVGKGSRFIVKLPTSDKI